MNCERNCESGTVWRQEYALNIHGSPERLESYRVKDICEHCGGTGKEPFSTIFLYDERFILRGIAKESQRLGCDVLYASPDATVGRMKQYQAWH